MDNYPALSTLCVPMGLNRQPMIHFRTAQKPEYRIVPQADTMTSSQYMVERLFPGAITSIWSAWVCEWPDGCRFWRWQGGAYVDLMLSGKGDWHTGIGYCAVIKRRYFERRSNTEPLNSSGRAGYPWANQSGTLWRIQMRPKESILIWWGSFWGSDLICYVWYILEYKCM